MNRLLTFIQLVCICIVFSCALVSCNGAKAYVKQGAKMEAAGMIDLAADHYFTAVVKKPQNIDALSGLKRTGQILLGRHLSSFDEALLRNDHEAAIDAFQKAESYTSKLESAGITLAFPAAKRALFEGVKNAHVEELYVEASEHLEWKRYGKALELFEQIEDLVPGFKDSAELADYSFCKPTYDLGESALNDKLYRTAFTAFSDVIDRDNNYEDASQMRDEALQAGRYTIALMKFVNGSNRHNVQHKLSSYTEGKLMSSSDPFLMIVDRESLDLILQEQELELSGLTDGAQLEIGSLVGAKAILKGTVVECSVSSTPLRHENMRGFEKYRIQRIDKEGKKHYDTKYRPVQYTKYNQSSEVTMSFTLKLISMETGAILSSENITSSQTDAISYIRYSGDKNNLYPARSNGAVLSSSKEKSRLRSLMNGRIDLKNDNVLIDDASKIIASKIQIEVEEILQTIVK